MYSSSSTPTEHIPAWGALSDWQNQTPFRENIFSASGRVCSFPSWPQGPAGWDVRAPNPFVRITDPETEPVWASRRGSWECARPVLSREQGLPPLLSWRHGAIGTARRAGSCTDMPVLWTQTAGLTCSMERSTHWRTGSSGRPLQTDLGDGCKKGSWKEVYERPSSRFTDPRLVVTHRFSWAQWCKGWKTLPSYRLDTLQAGPARPPMYLRYGSEVERRDLARGGPRRGLSVRCTLTWFQSLAEGVWVAFDDAPEPPTAACWREGGWVGSGNDPSLTLHFLLGPRDRDKDNRFLSRFWNNRLSTRPSYGGGREIDLPSPEAVPSLSGSPVPRPLTPPLTGGRPRRRAGWALQPLDGWRQQLPAEAGQLDHKCVHRTTQRPYHNLRRSWREVRCGTELFQNFRIMTTPVHVPQCF